MVGMPRCRLTFISQQDFIRSNSVQTLNYTICDMLAHTRISISTVQIFFKLNNGGGGFYNTNTWKTRKTQVINSHSASRLEGIISLQGLYYTSKTCGSTEDFWNVFKMNTKYFLNNLMDFELIKLSNTGEKLGMAIK